jgi:hypothetical protein
MFKTGQGSGTYVPELRRFLAANRVQAIVVTPGSQFAQDAAFLAPLQLTPQRVSDALVYQVPTSL